MRGVGSSVAVLVSALLAPAECSYLAAARQRQTVRKNGPSRSAAVLMSDVAVVTDGSGSFFGSRTIFQQLHDHGEFSKIVAFSSSTAEAKKMCLSRQARYSGLIDVLDFAEGGDTDFASAVSDATMWIAMNADGASVVEQVAAAKAAGIKRALVHLSASGEAPVDTDALAAALDASGITYTVMRTGDLDKNGSGGALILGEVDLPTCDEVPLDDAFRFAVEALTIPEASGRSFSLCPAADGSQLKEMRMAGYTRREECVALLKGLISDKSAEEREAEAPKAAEEVDPRSEAEIAAAQEAEVQALLAKAKTKGIENAKRRAEEEKIKEEQRAERMAAGARYFSSDGTDGGEDQPETSDDGSVAVAEKDETEKKADDDDDLTPD
jgi:hypothetical protein